MKEHIESAIRKLRKSEKFWVGAFDTNWTEETLKLRHQSKLFAEPSQDERT